MEAQVEKAIEIAVSPIAEQGLKIQAIQYLDQLKTSPDGWSLCLSLFTRYPRAGEIVRHVCLEIININIPNLRPEQLQLVKTQLWEYIRQVYGVDGAVDSGNVQNKLAQALTNLFAAMYPSGWATFFDDFLELGKLQSDEPHFPGIIIYLRTLNSIHDEIADVLVSRSSEEAKRNVILRDEVRERAMAKIVASWQRIMSIYQSNDVVVEMTLKVLGKWVSWIDISLVVNESLLSALFQFVGGSATTGVRDAAISALTEIVGKKMKTPDKIDLIVFLNLSALIKQIVESADLTVARSTSDYDTDHAEAVAKLVNIVMLAIVKALDEGNPKADELLGTFMPFVLRFFEDEYDEVSSQMISSLTELLTFFRKDAKTKPLKPEYTNMLAPILKAIIVKMKYDETTSWGEEDDLSDEAEFQDLRRRLKVLQDAVSAVNEPFYIEILSSVISGIFDRAAEIDWRELDLGLYEMFLFGESAVKAKGHPANAVLSELMVKMLNSGVASFNHPGIQLLYMENCVRYASFFDSYPAYIPPVLEHFVTLVHHQHNRVRLRSWYLFRRFINQVRNQVGEVAESVISAIADLLVIKAEVPAENDGSSEHSTDNDHAVFDSQIYLFEVVGLLASSPSISAEKQVLYATTVLTPIFADIQKHLPQAKSDRQAVLQVHHDLVAIGTLAHGFSEKPPGTAKDVQPSAEVQDVFLQASEATLVALEGLSFSADIRDAARTSFSRLVRLMDSKIFPQLPRWINGMLAETSSRTEISAFLRLLGQVVHGFKQEILSIVDSLFTPLAQKIYQSLAEPTSGTDDQNEAEELRKEYLTLLTILLRNNLDSVFISEVNQSNFESLITMLEQTGKTLRPPAISRLAFNVLNNMASLWGSSGVLPGFDRFMIERFSAVCWSVITDPTLKTQDAQTRSLMNEIASLQKTIFLKTGQDFVEYLTVYLPSINIGPEAARTFTDALATLPLEQFQKFFITFVQRPSGS